MKISTKTIKHIPPYLSTVIQNLDDPINLEQIRVKEFSLKIPPHPGNRHIYLLWSGGLDSTSALLMALESGCHITTINFNYGQQYFNKEESTINQLTNSIKKKYPQSSDLWQNHISIDISWLSQKTAEEFGGQWGHIFPLRNYVLIRETANLISKPNFQEIWFSCVQGEIPFSGGDKSILFLSQIQKQLSNTNLVLITPLIGFNKTDLVQWAYSNPTRWPLITNTISCFNGMGQSHCGQCQACFNRLVGFFNAGQTDSVGFPINKSNLTPFSQKYHQLLDSHHHYSITRRAQIQQLINFLANHD